MAASSKYKFTKLDTKKLTQLGYTFYGIDESGFADFMQKYFPGFDLVTLLEQVEQLMVPHAQTDMLRRVGVNGDMLQVRFENNFTSEDDALVFDRKFYRDKDGLKVSHEYLVLPERAREQDIGKKVLKASLEHYLKMKADIIEVVAGLSKGAYVWARHGFLAVNPAEMKRILRKARSELTDEQYNVVKAIYDNYYGLKPNGSDFPIKNWADLPFMKKVLMDPASQWEGRLDLNNPDQLRKFEEYVSRQKK